MELSFVIVNHKSEDYLKNCLHSLREAAFDFDYEIIIVQNDIAALDCVPADPRIRVVSAGANLGFAKANNLGANFCQGANLCFLNPDTLLLTPDLKPLLTLLPTHGIIAPQLVTNYDLQTQDWGAGKEVTVWEILKNNLGLGSDHVFRSAQAPMEADWVSGACLFITNELFQQLGGFDENFFMYFEDVDLCKRARDLNRKVLLFPSLKVLHWGGKSRQNSAAQKKSYYASQDYFLKKHSSLPGRILIKTLRRLLQKKGLACLFY